MQDKTTEGIVWTIITLFPGIAAVSAKHPLWKLITLLAAMGSSAKAVSCFQSSTEDAYRQLVSSKEYRWLPSA